LIIDGAAGHPLPEYGGKTCLELAKTPNLDAMAREGMLGMVRTVPEGMEPSSALACMSIMGYDPRVYYRGRSAIEALSMGIGIGEGEVVFRCNLVTIRSGRMADYSAGHITSGEAKEIINSLNAELGNEKIEFYPGVSYRHILKLKGMPEAVEAVCTPPHDIADQPIEPYLPKGRGSQLLRDLMRRSEDILAIHPVNTARLNQGKAPATSIWLFWPSGQVPALPSFQSIHGLRAAMISGVDLLRGLGHMAKMNIVHINGVTDGLDNDYAAQGAGAITALSTHDLVINHVESPDEAGHSGSAEHKIAAIEKIDLEIVSRLREFKADQLRVLVMPDHPTPVEKKTHTDEPVPFLLWGPGFAPNRVDRLTESEARSTGFFIQNGYDIINKLINPCF